MEQFLTDYESEAGKVIWASKSLVHLQVEPLIRLYMQPWKVLGDPNLRSEVLTALGQCP